MQIEHTPRGFSISEFTDRYGCKCSIQKSSLATEDCIWLGVDVNIKGKEVYTRMHLTQKMVADLLPILQKFVETGDL
jgi:hypothetical protein